MMTDDEIKLRHALTPDGSTKTPANDELTDVELMGEFKFTTIDNTPKEIFKITATNKFMIYGGPGPSPEMLVTFNLDDGSMTFGPNYHPDEAAKIFWEAVSSWRVNVHRSENISGNTDENERLRTAMRHTIDRCRKSGDDVPYMIMEDIADDLEAALNNYQGPKT
jgi:hypothetical protein